MGPLLRASLAVAALPTLSACRSASVDAELGQVTMVAGSQCQIAKIADLPVTMSDGHILIPASINGSEYLFLLDTGAGLLSVTPGLAAAEHLENTDQQTKALGVGGAVVTRNVVVPVFTVGGFRVHDTEMSTSILPRAPTSARQAAGILGERFLAAFDVEIDLPHRRVALYARDHCAEGFVPWTPPYVPFTATVTKDAVYIEGWLDGEPLLTLIDSGAETSVVTARGLRALDIRFDDLARDPKAQLIGAGLRSVDVRIHRFTRLRIGPDSFDHPLIAVGNIDDQAQLILGLDYLGRHRVWISYGTSQVFIAPPEPTSPRSQPAP